MGSLICKMKFGQIIFLATAISAAAVEKAKSREARSLAETEVFLGNPNLENALDMIEEIAAHFAGVFHVWLAIQSFNDVFSTFDSLTKSSLWIFHMPFSGILNQLLYIFYTGLSH